MASLQERNGSYRILFCHHGKLHTFTVGQVNKDEAETKARQVDYLLMRLKQRLLVLPETISSVCWRKRSGKGCGGFTRSGTVSFPRVQAREWINGLCRNGQAT